MRILAFIGLLPVSAWAACPAAPDHQAALDALIGEVQSAPNEGAAQQLSNEMWQYWADAPDEVAQEILDRGMRRRRGYDFLGALEDFSTLIDYCPDYAEGYNQRAFVYFLQQDYQAALPDLERALELSPRHVAAMSGQALVLLGLERFGEARGVLREAMRLNPWLPERGLIAPGGPLATGEQEL